MAFQDTFKALSDPVRREILIILNEASEKKSAGEISECFNLTNATISHHLKVLTDAKLIKKTKEKNYIYYEINTSVFEEILLWIKKFQ